MFNSLTQTYSRKIPSKTTDAYGQEIITYTKTADVNMFISLIAHNDYLQNNMMIKQATHTAVTFDSVAAGDLIDDKYEVTYVNQAGPENLVYLKEIENAIHN